MPTLSYFDKDALLKVLFLVNFIFEYVHSIYEFKCFYIKLIKGTTKKFSYLKSMKKNRVTMSFVRVQTKDINITIRVCVSAVDTVTLL